MYYASAAAAAATAARDSKVKLNELFPSPLPLCSLPTLPIIVRNIKKCNSFVQRDTDTVRFGSVHTVVRRFVILFFFIIYCALFFRISFASLFIFTFSCFFLVPFSTLTVRVLSSYK